MNQLYTFDKNPQMNFVAKAISKDATRPSIQHIYSTGTEIVATDSHRLHLSTTDLLPAGMYEVIKNTKTQTLLQSVNSDDFPAFPDYNRAIPEADDPQEIDEKYNHPVQVFAKVIRKMGTGTLDLKYFTEAVETGFFDSFSVNGLHSPVLFIGADTKAVIMPMKTQDDTLG
jgi:hypothetical protein